ncbi:MAG: hypothetical protein QX191_05700, partial [Methylococcaceae bacterium]
GRAARNPSHKKSIMMGFGYRLYPSYALIVCAIIKIVRLIYLIKYLITVPKYLSIPKSIRECVDF